MDSARIVILVRDIRRSLCEHPNRLSPRPCWPEYLEISRALDEYFNEATERIISEEVFGDAEEAEERPDASPKSAATLGTSLEGES